MQDVVNSHTVSMQGDTVSDFRFSGFRSALRSIYEVPSVFNSFGRFASQSGFFRFEKPIYLLNDFHELLRVLLVHRLLAQFVPAF
jgi:hypothetical protein